MELPDLDLTQFFDAVTSISRISMDLKIYRGATGAK